MLSPALLPLLLTFRLLLSTAVGFSQDHPCGSFSTWPRGGLKCPGLGLTCVGHPMVLPHLLPPSSGFQLGLVGGLNVPALGSHVWATPWDI